MFPLWLGLLVRSFRSRQNLLIENLVLRQQLAVLKRNDPRPRFTAVDRIFWLLARRLWSSWKQPLILVSPEKVIRGHGACVRWYWRLVARPNFCVYLIKKF